MTKSFAAFACVAAFVLLAATGVQAAGSPREALRGNLVVTQKDTTVQPAGPKDPSRTEQAVK